MVQSYGHASGITVRMDGPFAGGDDTMKMGSITLYADGWKGAASPYSQAAASEIVTVNSIVDLHPNYTQLAALYDSGIALVAENDAGAVTVYAMGGVPAETMTIPISVREVVQV